MTWKFSWVTWLIILIIVFQAHSTEFNTNCALQELYSYAMKYNEQLSVTLEEDEFSQKQRLAFKLEQVHNIMESNPWADLFLNTLLKNKEWRSKMTSKCLGRMIPAMECRLSCGRTHSSAHVLLTNTRSCSSVKCLVCLGRCRKLLYFLSVLNCFQSTLSIKYI